MKTIFARARGVMSETLKTDLELRDAYRANIAMAIHDSVTSEPYNIGSVENPVIISEPLDLTNVEHCNAMAERIIQLVFDK